MPITVVPRRKRKKTKQEKKDELSPRSKAERTGVIEGMKDFYDKSLGQVAPRSKKRKPIPVPSHKELMEGRKRSESKPKPKPKPKPKKKPESAKTKTLEYKGTPVGKRKRSRPA